MFSIMNRIGLFTCLHVSKCSYGSALYGTYQQVLNPTQNYRHFHKKAVEYFKRRKKPNVAVLNMRGSISSGQRTGRLNIEKLQKPIDTAFATKNLKEVCLIINSPGGSPAQSELIAEKIIYLSEKKNVQVTSFVEDVAASGGYWLACAGSNIYTTRTSIIGSIGVIQMGFGLQDFIKRFGIERRVKVKGKNKAFWDPFAPETPESKEIFDRNLECLYNTFTEFVKSRRGERLKAADETLFTGEFWVGQDGIDLGLSDGFNSLSLYLDKKYGDNVNIVEVNRAKQGLRSYFQLGISEMLHSELEDTALQSKYKFY